MSKNEPFAVNWREDGSATVLGRLTARNGTGAFTGKKGEGNFVQQADLVGITAKIFEIDVDGNPVELTPNPTVVLATSILDTPEDTTTNVLWTIDSYGYNFIHDLVATSFPTGGKVYRVEYRFEFVGGAIGWGVYEGPAGKTETS